jgi:hypothetical protein
LPDSWKEGHIFPIHKDGSAFSLTNYRGITLLNTMYKLYTNMLTERLSNVLESHNILSKGQAGFRKNHTTFQHIFTLINIISEARHLNKELHTLYLDIVKAFDSVEHWTIEAGLSYIGMDDETIKIFRALNTDTKCRVISPYGLSDFLDLTRGVKQGCALSPILFIIALEPLFQYLEQNTVQNVGYIPATSFVSISALAYADDIVLLGRSRADILTIFEHVCAFFNFHGIKINANKSGYSYRTSSDKTYNDIPVNGRPIPTLSCKESYKYLGIWINLNLYWKKQSAKLNQELLAMRSRVNWFRLSSKMAVDCINTLLISKVRYSLGVVLYNNELLEKL